jgi:hypothetical protein
MASSLFPYSGALKYTLSVSVVIHDQGDQDDRFLASCAIIYFGQFYEKYIHK